MRTQLVDIPRFREAPRDVVKNCRTLIPTAELVYIDDGAWYLGSVERTVLREMAGARKRLVAGRVWRKMDALKTVDPASAAKAAWMWWEGTLLMQGFAGIDVFTGEPDSRVEEFLRRRHYGWARDLDDTLRRMLAEDEQEERGEDAQDEAAKNSSMLDDRKLREAHRWAFRKPFTITSRYTPAQGAA